MWVVKIGGSLETASGLRPLLALLAEYGHSGIIIVPGGGRFADRVRAEQRATDMQDADAHRLAIRAMEQYAAVLCGMEPRLYPIGDISEISGAGGESTVPIWLPADLLTDEPGIPANWQVTSDSLALWFAGKINAQALILVKSVPNNTNDAQALAATGYLDEYFPEMIKKTGIKRVACISIDEQKILKQVLASGTIPLAHCIMRKPTKQKKTS